MKLQQLRFFVKVVETGNITQAAASLNVAQTALGLQIRNLEDRLNVALLERHSRGVRPTEKGALLYQRAVSILSQIDDLQREISEPGSSRSTVRLGIAPSILKLVEAEMSLAHQSLTGIDLHIVEELSFVLVDRLARGEIDYIIAYGVPDLPGLRCIPLLKEDLLHISAAGHGAQRGLGHTILFEQALGGNLVLVSERDVIWRTVHEAANEKGLSVVATFRVQSMQGIKTLIHRGIAQSIMPYGIVAEQIRSGEFEARRIVRPALRLPLHLAYDQQKRSAPEATELRKFVDQIRTILLDRAPYVRSFDHD